MSTSDSIKRLIGTQHRVEAGKNGRQPPPPPPGLRPRPTRPTADPAPHVKGPRRQAPANPPRQTTTPPAPRQTTTPQRPARSVTKPGLTVKQLLTGLRKNFPTRMDNAERDSVTVARSGRRGHVLQTETLTYNGTKKVPEIRRHKQLVTKRVTGPDDPVMKLPFSQAPVYVSCTCQDWLFTFEFVLAQKDAAKITYSNAEYPLLKNPHQLIGGCKHCAVVWAKVLKSGL